MRICPKNLIIISNAFKKYFNSQDHLWVFGSRANDSKKGGDIDFYIETHAEPKIGLKNKFLFVNELWKNLGEQKIDVVLHLLESKTYLPIYDAAKNTGVQIV